jgi:UDPglucose 6-dehydrogenase
LEPQLPELLEASHSHIRFTSDPSQLNQCQLIYLALDVPTDENGLTDLTPLNQLTDLIVAHASKGTTLVVLSQVPPGFTRGLSDRICLQTSSKQLVLFCQVETLIFGAAVERAMQPERFIVGCNQPGVSLPLIYSNFLQSFDCPVLPMRYESAELAKISVNMFLTSSVSTTNTLAELCESIGADWSEIVPALRMDRRIGQHAYLSPGLGLSGGNLERDLATITALAAEHGTDAGVVEAWTSNSRHRRDWVLKTIHSKTIQHCADPTIAIWGLAYKQDTDSTKNSPSIALLEILKPFQVRVYDPVVPASAAPNPRCYAAESEYGACDGADVLAVMTPWAQFAELDLGEVAKRMRGRVVLDPYRVLKSEGCRDAGLSYHTLGVLAE